MKQHITHFFRAIIKPTILAAFIIVLVASPRTATAQVTVLGDVQRAVQGSTGILDVILKGLETSAQVALKNGLRTFFDQIAYDTAVWIGSGDNNQKPLLFTKEAGAYLSERGDAAIGEVLDTLGEGAGIDLCNLPQAQGLRVEIQVNRLFDVPENPQVYQVDCSATQITASAENAFASLDNTFTEAKVQFAANPQSLISYYQGLFPKNNPTLAVLQAQQKIAAEKAKAENAATIERLKSDYKDQTGKVADTIETPAAVIEQNNELATEKSADGETTLTGNVFADSLNIFTNTLLSKLMDKAQSGLLSFFTQSDINESLRGSSATSRGGGIREARLQFASYKTPPISSSGTLDILSQFATCPTEGADVTNCVITDEFRTAIDQKKTVQQLVEETNIGNLPFGLDPNGSDITDPSQGISLRNITILRQYSVVPVGWELAAEYRKNYSAGTNVTLRQVMDLYDDCGEDNYSPYCGLVDPDWVLKAPEVFCKVEGYAENIGATSFIDNDGNPYTPQQLQVNRLKSCVDTQTCLSEDDTGACEAYGYCTKQEDIYRFEGESCPAHQASCELFTANDGSQIGYLKNTLNYNGCSSESDGCAWRCSVFNTVDQEFQCNGEDSIYTTCTSTDGCSDNLVQADGSACSADCTIANGGFRCSAEDQVCYLPGSETNTQYAINFDSDIQPCNESDQSCATFIPQVGSNLIANPSFERFFNSDRDPEPAATSTDAFGQVALGRYASDGSPCTGSRAGDPCLGWTQPAGPGWRVVTDASSGSVAVESETDSSGALTTQIKTGHPLANRSFALSYRYLNRSGEVCNDPGTARAIVSTTDTQVGRTDQLTYAGTGQYETIALSPYTFGSGVSTDTVQVTIGAPRDCNLIIDDVALIEITNATVSTAYQDYGATTLNLKTTVAEQCSPDDIGCQLYTPQTGPSRLPVPGRLTNPLSEACGNGGDFTNPACSQCFQQFVGCQAFVEEETPYQAPLKEFVPGLEDSATAIAKRTGFYCEGTATSCNPSRAAIECGAGVACVPSISITPSTGESCSAQDVGCEQYVNIDAQGAGGESLEYYSYIRQCVKPTATQIENGLVDTYYSFEGSDQTGYQIRSWYLKKSNQDAGPCTNLDLTGSTAQSADAACVDSVDNQAVCSADELGVNPDCTEYFDATGSRYYRLRSATITVSESCTALRNSQDSRLYYTIPAESQTCSASANLCREYKGSAGNNERFILDEKFDGTMWGGGTSSSTVASANNGQSMQIGSGAASTEAATVLPVIVSGEKSYIATFWAKGDAGQALTAFVNSPSTGNRQTFGTVSLNGEWQSYTVGPFVSNAPLASDSEFGFSYNGASAYIDNVQVFENNSVYMIAGSAETCNGFEGCQEYKTPNDQTAYIKSFEKLCDEADSGCTAVFNTQDSTSPFTERFNTDNDSSSDDVIVAADAPEARIVKPEAFCDASSASCEALGLPTISSEGAVVGFQKEFVLNDPDFYSNSLCTDEQLSCQAYSAEDGSVQYFKNPGNKTCTYDEGAGEWKTPSGDPCPLQNPSDAPSQPKGPVCDRGPREGELCSTDAECPTADDGSAARCVSDLDNDSGWVGQCNPVFAGCTNYLDPNSPAVDELRNTSFETDVLNNEDLTDRSSDNQPDNWEESAGFGPYITAVGLRGYGCDVVTKTEEHVADGKYAVKLQAINDFEYVCSLQPTQQIAVDPNKIYTLRGYVWAEGGAKFSIGLRYLDINGRDIQTPNNQPKDYAIAAYGGPSRDSVIENQWLYYHGMIGPNRNHSFPAGTARVQVVIEHAGTGQVLFDNIEFAEVDQYSYINSSVDGTAQSDVNTCNGTVDEGQGCVPFQDVTSTSNTYLSAQEQVAIATGAGDGFVVAPCQTRASDGQTICDGTINAADSNVVIQVQRDRQCSEWIACSGTNVTNINGQIVTTCQSLGTCKKRNPDTGVCSEWVIPPTASAIDSLDAITAESQAGDVSGVASIANYSGFIKVGMTWLGDETQQSVGYYPADWMPQRGTATSGLTQELIPDNDFESVTCGGDSGSSADDDVLQQAANAAQDRSARCTLDIHCRVQATETAVQTKLALENPSDQRVADIEYEQGWCNNVERDGAELQWNNWRSYQNAEMGIVDYDDAYQYVSPKTGEQPDTLTSIIVGAKSLDLNNVMVVQPVGDRESGLQVTLPDSGLFENGQEFVLSFDAKYLNEPVSNPDGTGDAIAIGLYYGGSRGAANQDFFTDDPDVNPFRFSTEWKNYTLGPVVISNHAEIRDAATLFIAQTEQSANTPFIIDNVSLRPALEVSGEGGIAGNKVDSDIAARTPNPQLVSRSCRAYPGTDSASCNYTDTTGAIYTGWKGYCLEKDPLRAKGCIAWWPVDTLAGESDLLRASIKMRYTDQAPAYHCLVAKGNENVGACSERGDACVTRSDCPTGELCLGNEPQGQCKDPQGQLVEDDTCDGRPGCVPYNDPDTTANDHNVLCNVDTDCSTYGEGSECEIPDEALVRFSEQNAYTTNYEYRDGAGYTDFEMPHEYLTKEYTMRNRIPSFIIDQDTHTDAAGTDQPREREEAMFRKFTNLPIEKQLHISEISNIIFNTGEANSPGTQVADVRSAKNSWNIDGSIAEISLAQVEEDGSDVAGTTTIQEDGSPVLWKVQQIGKDDEPGVGNAFNDGGNDAANAGVTAAQYGLWCGDAPCTTGAPVAALQNADFVFVKGTSNKADNDATGSILFGGGRLYNDGNPLNPFETFKGIMGVGSDEDSRDDIWSRTGRIGGTSGSSNQIGDYTIDNDNFFKYFAGRNIRDIDAGFDNTTTPCWGGIASQVCGANIQAVNFDFEDGYLRAVYVVMFNGFKRYDVWQIRNLSWTFELKEPCVLAVKSAARTDESIQVTPWRSRIQPTSRYTIPGLGYSYQLQSSSGSKKYSNILFGDLGVGDLSNNQWGSDKRTGRQHTTGAAGQLPLIYTNQNSALPFACIGECSENVCQNTSPYSSSVNQFDTISCAEQLWISVEGVCTQAGQTYVSPETQQSIPCDVRADDATDTCPGTTQCTGLNSAPYNLERKGGSGSTYAQELRNAVRTGWANYRNIFASLADGNVYLAQPRNATQLQLDQEIDGEFFDTAGTILDKFTLQELQAYDDADPSGDNRAIAEIGSILNEFQNMDLCPEGTNDQAADQYCAIRPQVNTIRLNGQSSGVIETNANQAATLTFRSFVDRDQEPLNTIQIDWQARPGSGFDETTPTDSWEAASGDHVYTHIYTCNPSPENDVQFVNGACEYKVRIRIQDNWNTCNGTDSPADRKDSCDSFDELEAVVRVRP